NSDNQPQ
ncbi:hypothetical protein D049_1793B, partial [Vibrio parahaemolyticus VPTS-2010]